jgi:hypothetical protein
MHYYCAAYKDIFVFSVAMGVFKMRKEFSKIYHDVVSAYKLGITSFGYCP